MKATGNFAACQDVDPMVALSDATRAHIDHWVAKFPPDRKRSALIQGLMAAQEPLGIGIADVPSVAGEIDLRIQRQHLSHGVEHQRHGSGNNILFCQNKIK